jgi:AraC-like DNA-binding protein
MVFENDNKEQVTVLPFYADGYPGIMFQITDKGLYVLPHHKKMPDLFLYGQTIHPIELKIEGAHKLIVFQLYPFVIKSFFGVTPKDLNDDCYDLTKLEEFDIKEALHQLRAQADLEKWKTTITSLLVSLFQMTKKKIDFTVQQALQIIIENNGQQTIKELREQLHITERTFERRFTAQVGVTPKQFSKIIQFQVSLCDITKSEYTNLADTVYKNGFADQSHFIRVFKAFTGQTPGKFSQQLS